MSRARRTWATAPLFALLGGVAPAATPLSAVMLHESCRAYAAAPESHEALVCASYVQGYLDSARSGAELRIQPADHPGARETWEERAARTRLGQNYLDALRKRDRRYCLPASVGLPEIIEQLLEYLRTHPPEPQAPAAEALSATLGLHHSCKQ